MWDFIYVKYKNRTKLCYLLQLHNWYEKKDSNNIYLHSCSFILSPNSYRPLTTHRHYIPESRNVTVNKMFSLALSFYSFALWSVPEIACFLRGSSKNRGKQTCWRLIQYSWQQMAALITVAVQTEVDSLQRYLRAGLEWTFTG